MKFVLSCSRYSLVALLISLTSIPKACAQQQAEGRGFLDELKLDDLVSNIFGNKKDSNNKQQLRKEGNKKNNGESDAEQEALWWSLQNNVLLGPVFGNLNAYITGGATTEISEGKRALDCILNANKGEGMARRNRNRIVSFLSNTPILESIGMGVLYQAFGASSSDIDVICGVGSSYEYSAVGEDPGPVTPIALTRDAIIEDTIGRKGKTLEEPADEHAVKEDTTSAGGRKGEPLEEDAVLEDTIGRKGKPLEEPADEHWQYSASNEEDHPPKLRGRGRRRQLQLQARRSTTEVAASMVEAKYPSLDPANMFVGRNDNLSAYLESGNLNDRAAIANVVDRLNDQIVVYQTTSQNLQAAGQFINAIGEIVSTVVPLVPTTEIRFNPGSTIDALGALLEGIGTATTTTTARLQRSLRAINDHKSRIDSAEIEASYQNTRALQQQLATASQTSQLLLQQVTALADKVDQLESKLSNFTT